MTTLVERRDDIGGSQSRTDDEDMNFRPERVGNGGIANRTRMPFGRVLLEAGAPEDWWR